jgi:hypothetical protein
MTSQLFIDASENEPYSYHEYFKDSIGKGSGKYYSGIGEIYKAGTRYQKGYGLLGVSQNDYTRRGDGLGNMLSNLWRMAFPMIKQGAQKMGSAALDVATNVASDVLKGKDLKQAAKEHLKAKGSQLLEEINPSLIGQIDKPIDTVEPTLSSPPPALVATPPSSFRKIPRKRVSKKVTFSVGKKAKYPALKYL